MSYKEIYELSNELYAERLELVEERIEQIIREPAIEPAFADYFTSVAKCINTIKNHSADKKFNDLFYSQFDKENYEKSYANPAYAVKVLGDEYGQLLSAVYAKIAGSITHIYQGDIKYLCIYAELIVELYNYFENANELSPDEIRGCIYSFMHDYEEIFAEDDNRALLDPAYDYYTELVNEADLSMMIICILTDCMSERMSAPAEHIWLHFQMRRYRLWQIPIQKDTALALLPATRISQRSRWFRCFIRLALSV